MKDRYSVEVRCCCTPKKLLGWIDISRPPRMGEVWAFPTNLPIGYRPNYMSEDKIEVISLQLEGYNSIENKKLIRGIAFKSEETPIETLRRITGFRENL